jgi:phosphoglycerate dehydrogenase-like enzyme
MKAFFYLPQGTIEKCFRPGDVARLSPGYEVVAPPCTDEASLAAAYAQHAPQAEALVTGWGTQPLTPAMLDAAPRLKVIVHSAGSIKTLIPPVAWERGIRVGTTNEALGIGVAETTLGMIIAGMKGFFPSRAWTAAGNWHDRNLGTQRTMIREVFDVTIGIISASKVGRHVMRLLRSFEVNVLVADPYLTADEAGKLGATLVPLDELLRRSDVVSLHAPALPATRHMLGREQFRAMKDQAVFINTARGMIVDEAALIAELKTGRISAFIDVTDPEPPAKDHPFRTLPNVVLTPHLAGHVSNGCFRQGRSAVNQLLEFKAGRRMHGEVTPEAFAIMA